MTAVRLNRYLAAGGLGSRRAVEALITAGRVTVNGEVECKPARRVEPGDLVTVAGREVVAEPPVYVLLHKPAGVVTTAHDPQGRPTVVSLVRRGERLYPVGRLDADTTGALLLTNDGALANRLMHPRYGVRKVYRARVRGVLGADALRVLRQGVILGGRPTAPAEVEVLSSDAETTTIELVLHEGRNRQVRRMCQAVGHRVLELERTRYATLALDGLAVGQTRELTPGEVEELRAVAGA